MKAQIYIKQKISSKTGRSYQVLAIDTEDGTELELFLEAKEMNKLLLHFMSTGGRKE